MLSNDLQGAALSLRPELTPLLEQGLDASAHGAIVSGSGPTTVFLCESREHALEVGSSFEVPVLIAEAPVHGARVVSR